MSLRLTVVGCSGSLPGPSSSASCYLVQTSTTTLVLDLGSGSLGPLQQHIDLADLDAVLLSHLHPDHCMDVCGLYVARRYGPAATTERLPIWGPAAARDQLTRAYGMPAEVGMTEVLDFRSYPDQPDPDEEIVVGDIRVTLRRVLHPVPAYGLRLTHQGRVLAYSGDTGVTPALTQLAEGADVLLSEAAFRDGVENPPGIHLTGREAGQHAQEAGAARLVVTHVPPWFDPAVAAQEARTSYDGPVDVAVPGLALDV